MPIVNKNIFIISHSSGIEGPIDYYCNYLKKNNAVVKLEHPLDDYKNRATILWDDNTQVVRYGRNNHIGVLNLGIDFFLSLRCMLKYDVDVFIGANNFDVLAGIVARKVFGKKITRIIYFASDFSGERFVGAFMNLLYKLAELVSCRWADLVVSNTKRAEVKRFSLGLKKDKSLVVPNGALLEKEDFSEKKIDKKKFIFIGSVTKEHGLYDLISLMHPLMEKLVIIGQGADWDRVVAMCQEKNISVEFYSKKDQEFCLEYMKNFDGIGLAPYNSRAVWTYYCSPLKVVEYIACGLPVLMSSVPEIAFEVKERGLGMVYESLDYDGIKRNLENFDANNFNVKAAAFYKKYNQHHLYAVIA